MGEVYRATDTNLARQVAIKVLPAAMAADVERIARFDREAKTLAALNHPNIAAIYGLERSSDSVMWPSHPSGPGRNPVFTDSRPTKQGVRTAAEARRSERGERRS
jgi:serine/threonine protein kinase